MGLAQCLDMTRHDNLAMWTWLSVLVMKVVTCNG